MRAGLAALNWTGQIPPLPQQKSPSLQTPKATPILAWQIMHLLIIMDILGF
jgi:hypothetical protein